MSCFGKKMIMDVDKSAYSFGRNKRSTSLKNYIAKYNPTESFRISERNIGDTGDIISVPLYAAFCLFEKM